jgi:hypothetical protein
MTALQGWIVAAGVNHAWNSRHRCRDRSPAVPMAYLQSITMLVIWLGSGGWFRHTSCPPAASRRPGLSRNWTPLLRIVAFAEYEISLLFLGQFVPVRGKGFAKIGK